MRPRFREAVAPFLALTSTRGFIEADWPRGRPQYGMTSRRHAIAENANRKLGPSCFPEMGSTRLSREILEDIPGAGIEMKYGTRLSRRMDSFSSV